MRRATFERAAAALLLASASSVVHAHSPGLDQPLPALSEYLRLGFEHILGGFDHLAFLLGLTLTTRSPRALLLAVTAFTLAHSLSLALCVLGVVAPASRWVEVAIALSIAYVALENRYARNTERRYRISFVFGFVHGFGFASALQEIGVPPERAPAALALFNGGVEAGQLAALLVIVPGLRWLRRRPALSVPIVHVVNGALFVLGLGWAAQRTFAAPPVFAASVAAVARAPALVSTSPAAGSARATLQLPAAEQLCQLLMRLPRERRAACANQPVGVTLEQACSRALSASLASGALRIVDAHVAQCQAELQARYASCDFGGSAADSCRQLWAGQRAAGAECRSSLECHRGLQCRGVGPFDAGVCAAPLPAGAACGRSIDPLASYLPNAAQDHPECSGACVSGRCRTITAAPEPPW